MKQLHRDRALHVRLVVWLWLLEFLLNVPPCHGTAGFPVPWGFLTKFA